MPPDGGCSLAQQGGARGTNPQSLSPPPSTLRTPAAASRGPKEPEVRGEGAHVMQLVEQRARQRVCLQGQWSTSGLIPGRWRWEGGCRHSADLRRKPGIRVRLPVLHTYYVIQGSCFPRLSITVANTNSRSAEKLK